MATTLAQFIAQLKVFMADNHSKDEAATQLGTIIDAHTGGGGGGVTESYPLTSGTFWTITHTMPSPCPAVTVTDGGGNDMELEVVYTGLDTLTLRAGTAMSGTVYLS